MSTKTSYEQDTREYAEWQSILESGAPLHPPWRDFRIFLRDTGRCSLYGYKLVRINPESAYCPGNVRWACQEQGYVPNRVPGKRRQKRALVAEIPFDVLAKAAADVRNRSQLELKLFGAAKIQRARALEARCVAEGVDLSHWTGRHVRKPWMSAVKIRPIGTLSASAIRKRVLQERSIPYQCAECGMPPEWHGAKLTLHLDHINGDKFDHSLTNLQFLCPNCHQQTKTWGNQRSRILPESDDELLELAKTKTRKEIAHFYGVSPSSISNRLRKYYA